MSSLGGEAQNNDLGASLQTLLTEVKLCLWCRLQNNIPLKLTKLPAAASFSLGNQTIHAPPPPPTKKKGTLGYFLSFGDYYHWQNFIWLITLLPFILKWPRHKLSKLSFIMFFVWFFLHMLLLSFLSKRKEDFKSKGKFHSDDISLPRSG